MRNLFQSGIYYILLAVLYAQLLHSGGIGKLSMAIFAIVTGGLLIWQARLHNAAGAKGDRLLIVSGAAYASCLLIGIIQCLPGLAFGQSGVLYEQTAQALGHPVRAFLSVAPQDSAFGVLRLLAYGAVFQLGLAAGADRKRAVRLLTVMAFSGGAFGLASLYHYTTLVNAATAAHTVFVPPSYILTMVRNHFADVLGIHVIITLALLWHSVERHLEKNRNIGGLADRANHLLWSLLPLLMLIFILGAALILTASRAGILSSFIGILALCFLLNCVSSPSSPRLRSAVFSTAIIVLFAGLFVTGGMEAAQRYSHMELEIARRLQIDHDTLPVIAFYPITGSGIDSYVHIFKSYSSEALLLLFDKNIEVEHAHNGYLEVMATMGLPGFLLLMTAITAIALRCLRGACIRQRHKALPATGAAIAALTGFHALFDSNMQIPVIALLVAFILGIAYARALPERSAS